MCKETRNIQSNTYSDLFCLAWYSSWIMLSEILKMMGGLDILSLLCHVNIILCPLHVAGDTILQGAWCEIRFLRDFYLTTIHMMAVKGIPTNLVWLKQIKDRNSSAWRKNPLVSKSRWKFVQNMMVATEVKPG